MLPENSPFLKIAGWMLSRPEYEAEVFSLLWSMLVLWFFFDTLHIDLLESEASSSFLGTER